MLPAFSIPRPRRHLLPIIAPLGGALAASALATLLAVLAAVLAAWRGDDGAFAFSAALATTLAAPALAMVLWGVEAKAAVRVVAGGMAAAPSIAVHYLFLGHAHDDVAFALGAAVVAALGALSAWRLEKEIGTRGWWMLAAFGVAALWLVGVSFAPAEVWVEAPWR